MGASRVGWQRVGKMASGEWNVHWEREELGIVKWTRWTEWTGWTVICFRSRFYESFFVFFGLLPVNFLVSEEAFSPFILVNLIPFAPLCVPLRSSAFLCVLCALCGKMKGSSHRCSSRLLF